MIQIVSAVKSAKHGLFFNSERIFDQIFIALNFIILAPEFEHDLKKTILAVDGMELLFPRR